MRIAWVKFCSAISTVSRYCSFSCWILSMVRRTRIGASPTEGSSINRMRGASISARPSASICCSPPLRLPASWRRRSASCGNASKQNARLFAICARAMRRKAPSKRFSSTVSLGNSRRPSGTSAMPRSTIASVLRPTRSCCLPSISAKMLPALGRTMPMMHFMSVLLPLPLVPSSTTVSPELTLSDTSSSTRTAPYAAWTRSSEMLLPKIRPLDFGIANDVLRRAVGDLLAGDQNDEPLREAHHRAHDVLDQDDGDAALAELNQELEDVIDLRMGETGHRLVGDQELAVGRHGAGKLELAHLDLGEVAREASRLRLQADEPEQLGAARIGLAQGQMRAAPGAHRIEQRNAQVVGERQARERARQLEAARHAEPGALMRREPLEVAPVEPHGPGLVVQHSGQAIDERALAGAI